MLSRIIFYQLVHSRSTETQLADYSFYQRVVQGKCTNSPTDHNLKQNKEIIFMQKSKLL